MIVATAGHVDHGKTALVKAITGVDTDRLPEEKKRGLTIDLGFVYESLGGGITLGFVDVPGHEKFIRNMMAGVAGIDVGLLVVAADDGVMPQTVEHCAILDLLGIADCVVVISKTDRASRERVDEVTQSVRNLLDASGLEASGTYPVCAPSGEGVEELRRALHDRAKRADRRATSGYFRLAVDRCFNLRGAGLIVTGTVFSGRASVGDRMVVAGKGLPVRIRSIHANNHEAGWALPGWRCALNLSGKGISKSRVGRGDWILDSAIDAQNRRIDTRIRVLASEDRALRHWTPVHVHLGTAHLTGRVAVLGGGAIKPGEQQLAQLVLDKDLATTFGDRFVLRDQSAIRSIGGGAVIDPFSPVRGRARPDRLAWLNAIDDADSVRALERVLALTPSGVLVRRFQQTRNITDDELTGLLADTPVIRRGRGGDERLLDPGHWARLQDQIVAAVREFHRAKAEVFGPNPFELRTSLPASVPEELLGDALAEMAGRGELVQQALHFRLPGHRVRISEQDLALWHRVRAVLDPAQGSPPSLHQSAVQLELELTELGNFVKRACRTGMLAQIARNRFIPVALLHRLAVVAERLAESMPENCFTIVDFRDEVAFGRNFVIDLLEFFDRSGFTERLGDARRIRRPAAQVFGVEKR